MGLCNTKHMGHLFRICLLEGRIMTFPLIQACFILYSLHMWTYQRPNGTQEQAPLNDPREHFHWEAIRGNIVHIVHTGLHLCVSEPRQHRLLIGIIHWKNSDPFKICSTSAHMCDYLSVCVRECAADTTTLSCLFSSTPG